VLTTDAADPLQANVDEVVRERPPSTVRLDDEVGGGSQLGVARRARVRTHSKSTRSALRRRHGLDPLA